MPRKLKNLKIDRVDLVDKGANQESHIMLFKRDHDVEKAMTLREILSAQEEREQAQHDKWRIVDAFVLSLKSSCDEDRDEQLRIAEESAKEFIELMTPVHDKLVETEDVYMSAELEKKIKELEKKNQELEKRAEVAELALSKRDDNDPEDIWKGVPDIVRKKFEEQEAEIAVSKKAAEEERHKRLKQEAIQKASRYDNLPINPDDDADLFVAIDSLEESYSKRIYQLFDAGDANLKKSLNTSERGSTGNPDGGGDDEESQLTKMIETEMKESNIDYNEALGVVAKRHPDLYQKYSRSVMTKGR